MSLVMQTENGRYSCWLDSQRSKRNHRKVKNNKLYDITAYYIAYFQANTYAYHWQSKYQ